MWLKRIRREKELEQNLGGVTVHAGFRCDGCDVEPIIGSRFQGWVIEIGDMFFGVALHGNLYFLPSSSVENKNMQFS